MSSSFCALAACSVLLLSACGGDYWLGGALPGASGSAGGGGTVKPRRPRKP